MADIQVNGGFASQFSDNFDIKSEDRSQKLESIAPGSGTDNISEEKNGIHRPFSEVEEDLCSETGNLTNNINSSDHQNDVEVLEDNLVPEIVQVDNQSHVSAPSISTELNELSGEEKAHVSEDLDRITLTGSYVKISLEDEIQDQPNNLEDLVEGQFFSNAESDIKYNELNNDDTAKVPEKEIDVGNVEVTNDILTEIPFVPPAPLENGISQSEIEGVDERDVNNPSESGITEAEAEVLGEMDVTNSHDECQSTPVDLSSENLQTTGSVEIIEEMVHIGNENGSLTSPDEKCSVEGVLLEDVSEEILEIETKDVVSEADAVLTSEITNTKQCDGTPADSADEVNSDLPIISEKQDDISSFASTDSIQVNPVSLSLNSNMSEVLPCSEISNDQVNDDLLGTSNHSEIPLNISSVDDAKEDSVSQLVISDDPLVVPSSSVMPNQSENESVKPLIDDEIIDTLEEVSIDDTPKCEEGGSSDVMEKMISEEISVCSIDKTTQDNASSISTETDSDDLKPLQKSEEHPIEEWLDILGNGLLKKKVLEKGKGEKTRPLSGNYVTISFEGKLQNGTVVEKAEKHRFILGDEDVIQAFDLAVALMELNEKAILTTDARYAYGIYGRPDLNPPIPQNSPLTYEIEVLSVSDGPIVENLSSAERVGLGNSKRIRGNELYSRDDFSGAINLYKRGVKYLEGCDDKDVFSMKIKCLNNLSAAQLKVKAFKMAIQSLDSVLQYEPKNVKALFRKGKCLDGMKKEEEALEYLKKASSLDPNNKSISTELSKLKTRVASTQKKEKEIYQKMFNQKKEDKISTEEENLNWTVKLTASVVGVLGMIAAGLWYKNK